MPLPVAPQQRARNWRKRSRTLSHQDQNKCRVVPGGLNFFCVLSAANIRSDSQDFLKSRCGSQVARMPIKLEGASLPRHSFHQARAIHATENYPVVHFFAPRSSLCLLAGCCHRSRRAHHIMAWPCHSSWLQMKLLYLAYPVSQKPVSN